MKYLKFFAAALCAVGFTSCGDFDFTPDAPKINTLSGVTVSMKDAEINFWENKGIVTVPFTVEGERNGDITVECMVTEVLNVPETEPAFEDAHYIFTQHTVIVSKEDNSGVFEIRLFNDKEINDNRVFDVKLTTTQGCSVTGLDQTMITIKDDDKDPYIRLGGEWVLTTASGASKSVNFVTYDEGEEGFYRYYTVTGLFSDPNGSSDPVEIIAKFDYNKTTKEGSISFDYGQDLTAMEHPTYGLGTGVFGFTFGNYISYDGSAVFTWNETGDHLELESWAGQDEVETWGAGFAYLLHFDAGWMVADEINGVTGFNRAN